MTDKKRAVEISDLSYILNTEEGVNLIARILEKTGYYESTFDTNERDCVYDQGRRSIGVWLYREVKEASVGGLRKVIDKNVESEEI